jgi:hypothetical protein
MYYPFFRGRQYELKALAQLSSTISSKKIIPILEPTGFRFMKDFPKYASNGMTFILIVNPRNRKSPHPQISPQEIRLKIIEKHFAGSDKLNIGIIIDGKTQLHDIKKGLEVYDKLNKITLVHLGAYKDPKALLALIDNYSNVNRHVFDEGTTTEEYRAGFGRDKRLRVILRDSFIREVRNADYPADSYVFSELHKTFAKEGYDGFGDYTITGNSIKEGGGPAHAVAIHFTFAQKNNAMMQHFVSDRTTGASDTPGKFREANKKLNSFLSGSSHVFGIGANEYINYHDKRHFPNLGNVKRASMIRHVEVYSKLI